VAAKYISHFPKPVLDDLVNGKWLPVIGAGMSLNAVVPKGKKMPLWGDLGKALTDQLADYSPSSVLDGISAYQHEFDRARLIEQLSEILLIRDAQPGLAHKEFCTIPFDIVCTTNFDFLLERQYDATPHYVYPVVDEEQLSIGVGNAGTLLLKLHGDLRHPSRLVVTEADYDGFLANYPLLATYLANQLITKTAVFIGYSLEDPDFRQIWHVVSARLGRTRRKAYAIAVNARAADVARYERRGVKVINLPGGKAKYGDVLAATFRELREYIRDNVVGVSKVTEERPLRELLLPRDAETRLCFFSLPLELLPFYRERVFPAVEDAGFVPVTADDVVTPGDSISAKVDMLIDRSAVMVVEIGSSWTLAEYRMAVARIKDKQPDHAQRKSLTLIVVTGDNEPPPLPAPDGLQVIVRPNILKGDLEPFVDQLATALRRLSGEVGVKRQAEPARLLASKEYRAAVISAMSLLEAKLRERLNKSQWPEARNPLSLRSLLSVATNQEVLNPALSDSLHKWMRLRNEVVHSSKEVSRAQATELVNGVLGILHAL
jgi:hypothetical protein